MNQATWVFDEFQHLGVDFDDPEQVASYDTRQHTDVSEERQFVQTLGIAPEHSVVEYGAGTGALAVAAAAVCRQVFAVDISRAMLAVAQRRAAAAGVRNVSFHQAGS